MIKCPKCGSSIVSHIAQGAFRCNETWSYRDDEGDRYDSSCGHEFLAGTTMPKPSAEGSELGRATQAADEQHRIATAKQAFAEERRRAAAAALDEFHQAMEREGFPGTLDLRVANRWEKVGRRRWERRDRKVRGWFLTIIATHYILTPDQQWYEDKLTEVERYGMDSDPDNSSRGPVERVVYTPIDPEAVLRYPDALIDALGKCLSEARRRST